MTLHFQELLLPWFSKSLLWRPVTRCEVNGSSLWQWQLIHVLCCTAISSTCHCGKFQNIFSYNTTWLINKHGAIEVLLLQLKSELSKTLKEVSDPSLPLCWKGKKPFKSVLDVKKEFKSLVLSFANGKKALMEIPPENYLIVTVSSTP